MRYLSPIRLAKKTTFVTRSCVAEGLGRRHSLALPVDGDISPSPEEGQFGTIYHHASSKSLPIQPFHF